MMVEQALKAIKRLSVALMLLLASAVARADIADLFQQYDHGATADRDLVKILIVGVEDGLGAANDELKATGNAMLYCAPETDRFTGDQLVEILRKWVEANRSKAPRLERAPPATALLLALEGAFPCK
jgi:hypothetical protein